MPDPQPQEQPESRPPQDWHAVGAQEIEQTLSSAADLAHELAGDVGVTADEPRFRETSELESIETALDVELKNLEHLVSRTKEELSEGPPADPAGPRTASVPDFMSEFLTDEPVTVMPDPRAFTEVAAQETGSNDPRPEGSAVSTGIRVERRGQAVAPPKAGLIGVGSLGHRKAKKPAKSQKSASNEQPSPSRRTGWARALARPVYVSCAAGVRLLEIIDRPFARISAGTRRGLSVTALAAFCVCLLMFLLSMLFS